MGHNGRNALGAPYSAGGTGLRGYAETMGFFVAGGLDALASDGPECDVIKKIRASHPFTLAGERRALELSVMLDTAAKVLVSPHASFELCGPNLQEEIRQAVALRCARLGLA